MLIYKATFPNGKFYIGQTIYSLEKRKYEHERTSKHNKNIRLVHRAIKKYGIDNVIWEVIEDNINDRKLLNDREEYWIKELGTMCPNGYNLNSGGHQTEISEKTRKKASKSIKKSYTPELRELRRQQLLKRYEDGYDISGENNANYGKKWDKERCEAHSKRLKESKVMCGEKNPFYGKHITEDMKRKRRETIAKKLKDKKCSWCGADYRGGETSTCCSQHCYTTRWIHKKKELMVLTFLALSIYLKKKYII